MGKRNANVQPSLSTHSGAGEIEWTDASKDLMDKPFDDDPSSAASHSAGGPNEAIVVFVHVHYADVWEEMAQLLAERLAVPFRLVLTTSLDGAALARPETPHLVSTTVLPIDNRGRDIRPFLHALRRTEGYAIGLKLHTKRSTHRIDGEGWRESLVNSLLPGRDQTSVLVDRFRSDDRIALLAPDAAFCSIDRWIGRNAAPMRRVARRLGIELAPTLALSPLFAAGSMFWFRRSALEPFAVSDLDDLFEPEAGQVDGTAAHALERLFAPVSEGEGRVATTPLALLAGAPGDSLDVLRARSRAAADAPSPFLRLPPKILALAARHFPPAVRLYQLLPKSLRRLAKAILSPGHGPDPW